VGYRTHMNTLLTPPSRPPFSKRHLLQISDLNRLEALELIERAEAFLPFTQAREKKLSTLKGRTLVNLFFENSTRTQASFELAGKRMSADTINMSVKTSSVAKGETLLDTAATLNAMGPDLLVVRHASSGAAQLLARKVGCSVINAGDGKHEHPTQALLDALTIKRSFGHIEGLIVAICGDVLHSRVARSNVILLSMLGARVRLVAPPTLMPADVDRWGCEIYHDMREGIAGADIIMMLRLQLERMDGAFVPSAREYFRFHGLDHAKLALAAPHVKVMHPGPMNRGIEIDSEVADDPRVSLIVDQVESGVAVRMAVLEALASHGANDGEGDDNV
jgi:aspartate carbamoyltransferase catalytic subunit